MQWYEGKKQTKISVCLSLSLFYSLYSSRVGGETDHILNCILYGCVIPYITFSDLKHHTVIISVSVGSESEHGLTTSCDSVCPGLRCHLTA